MYFNFKHGLGILILLCLNTSPARASKPAFDPKVAPSAAEWRHFMAQTDSWRHNIWRQWSLAGSEWGDWAWQWRSAWLRGCRQSKSVWCSEILKKGLFDKAAVVRGEAAMISANLYENSRNKSLMKLLLKAYALPENNRNGKPLFVKRKFLYALQKVGMPESDLRKVAGTRFQSYVEKIVKK